MIARTLVANVENMILDCSKILALKEHTCYLLLYNMLPPLFKNEEQNFSLSDFLEFWNYFFIQIGRLFNHGKYNLNLIEHGLPKILI
jgi:hypothetical protein